MLSETSDSPTLPDRVARSNVVPAEVFHADGPAIIEPEYLSECSPKDRPWDQRRSQADQIATIYLNAQDSRWFLRLGKRVEQCSQVLGFAWSPEKDDFGVLTLKLRNAYFCRVRHCPVCQWRRSLMWTARFLQAAPGVLAQHPQARFIFLTLTLKNVPVDELRTTLGKMSKAWDRITKRKPFAVVLGWIRTVEVTRGKDGSAHPHYHALLMVPSDYFGKTYITQAAFTNIWRESLRLDYDPIVNVKAVKSRRAARRDGLPSDALMDAARETFKYAVKPSDMASDPVWFLELTRQLHKLRFIASGGVLKEVLRENDETNDDLLVLGEGKTDEGPQLFFSWWRPVRRYKRQRGPIHSAIQI